MSSSAELIQKNLVDKIDRFVALAPCPIMDLYFDTVVPDYVFDYDLPEFKNIETDGFDEEQIVEKKRNAYLKKVLD